MTRIESDGSMKLLGSRLARMVWKCFDTYKDKYGIPDEKDNYTVDLNITHGANIIKFDFNNSKKVIAFESIMKASGKFKIISLDNIEYILTSEEESKIEELVGRN